MYRLSFLQLVRPVPLLQRPSAQPNSSPGVSLPAPNTAANERPFTSPSTPQQTDSVNAEPQRKDSWPSRSFQFIGGPLKGMQRAGPLLPRRKRHADGVVEAAAAADAAAPKKFLGLGINVWSKIIPLGLMFFCILFNYTILRDTKVCRNVCCWCGQQSLAFCVPCLSRIRLVACMEMSFATETCLGRTLNCLAEPIEQLPAPQLQSQLINIMGYRAVLTALFQTNT